MKTYLLEKRLLKKLITLLSIVFLVCGCSITKSIEDSRSTPITSDRKVETFQEYLWYENPVVLMLHIAVMLAGAIGSGEKTAGKLELSCNKIVGLVSARY